MPLADARRRPVQAAARRAIRRSTGRGSHESLMPGRTGCRRGILLEPGDQIFETVGLPGE